MEQRSFLLDSPASSEAPWEDQAEGTRRPPIGEGDGRRSRSPTQCILASKSATCCARGFKWRGLGAKSRNLERYAYSVEAFGCSLSVIDSVSRRAFGWL